MKRPTFSLFRVLIIGIALLTFLVPSITFAQTIDFGSDFTYQGYVESGGLPVTDTCDFAFSLFDSPAVGTQIGATQNVAAVTVIGGVFTVSLDFGETAFNGIDHFLEISVGCDETPTLLSPRQPITPAPYALGMYGLYTQPNATSPNIIGGWRGNSVTANVVGATISGGGQNGSVNTVTANYASIGGGYNNTASGDNATVGGGDSNRASSEGAIVGGGRSNNAGGSYVTIGGGFANSASGESATIAGGDGNTAIGSYATIGGGVFNSASASYATVGGGTQNTAIGEFATVGGGVGNTVIGDSATVGGGQSNNAGGNRATVSGGQSNTAIGDSATVAGGAFNTAAADFSFAAGSRASVDSTHTRAFVWSGTGDGAGTTSWGIGTFTARAPGGVRFYSSASGTTNGVQLSAGGGSWASLSDRNAKFNFADVDSQAILQTLVSLPITTWSYNGQSADVRHIGPVAQDFYAAFGIGEGDTRITTVDADGVALAAIQGLFLTMQEESAAKDATITALEAQLAAHEARIAALESLAAGNGLSLPIIGAGFIPLLAIFALTRRKK